MSEPEQFICEACGKQDVMAPEEDVLAHLQRDWPGTDPKDCVKVCDLCYELLMEIRHA